MFRWGPWRRHSDRERELEEELRFCLAQEERDRIEAGDSPEQARLTARRDFGNVTLIKEVARSMWTWTSIERVAQDLKIALRGLRRSPAYVAVVVTTLALGIGATTALFTVVNAVLLRPLQFPDPSRLVIVWERTPFMRADGRTTNVVQPLNFLDWQARNRSFTSMAAFQRFPMNVSGSLDADQVTGLLVTGDFFTVLGVRPILGRTFVGADDVAAPTVVLTHGFWQRRLGGDPAALGKRVTINGAPHEIIGVMPPEFAVPGRPSELFVPRRLDRALAARDGRNYTVIARLRPGVSVNEAGHDMASIAAQTARERPAFNTGWSATVIPLMEDTVNEVRRPLIVLFGAVMCVLLIACANIVNLSLMRATARRREMSVRLALGAGRGRLVHQLLIESLVLAAIGGALGLALAAVGVDAVVSMFPPLFPLPRSGEISVDWRVLTFVALASIGAGAVFGVVPAFQSDRRGLFSSLQSAVRTIGGDGSRIRAALVIGQVAMTVVLVVAAGLMVRTLIHLGRVELGFRPERLLTVRMVQVVAPGSDRDVPVPARRAIQLEEMLERIRALPGVSAAASINLLPGTGLDAGSTYYRADRPAPPPAEQQVAAVSVVTPGFFSALGIRFQMGRDFNAADRSGAPIVAVVNRAFVKQTFGGENAIGKHVRMFWGVFAPGQATGGAPDFEIVGVVGDTRHDGMRQPMDPRVYIANAQAPNPAVSLTIRTTGNPSALVSAVRRIITDVNPSQGVSSVQTMETIVAESIASSRIQTVLFTTFGALALVVACVGLYGVLAYSVEQRRRELGVRLALGAATSSVLRLVLARGLKLTIAGIVAGVVVAMGVTRVLETLLFEVRPNDPGVLTAVAALLIVTSAGACYLPARRATRVDPASVLRDE